ncbi:hypothetical protein QNI16_27300 [Cytophagaceae bacterium YF14B1]|uniref:Uncharacterized protein n=1 Tax=Xanthocytophaga flava TaxID=3048013 RepID=A0AAE3UBY8_9BACT|nr:hypothetical protein [Xanthocytophaga flavus]MDJ1484234.1 hypothetical protein [Xanthocytophaga flavus]
MLFTSTSQLAASLLQEENMLQEAQQFAVESGVDFPVHSNIISHLIALKVQGEEKFHVSLQRREIFQNKIQKQKQNLSTLHQTYNKFQELYKSYQSMIRKDK